MRLTINVKEMIVSEDEKHIGIITNANRYFIISADDVVKDKPIVKSFEDRVRERSIQFASELNPESVPLADVPIERREVDKARDDMDLMSKLEDPKEELLRAAGILSNDDAVRSDGSRFSNEEWAMMMDHFNPIPDGVANTPIAVKQRQMRKVIFSKMVKLSIPELMKHVLQTPAELRKHVAIEKIKTLPASTSNYCPPEITAYINGQLPNDPEVALSNTSGKYSDAKIGDIDRIIEKLTGVSNNKPLAADAKMLDESIKDYFDR